MTEKIKKLNKSKPTISVSFPFGPVRDQCMSNLRGLVGQLKKQPGTLVETQSGLIRALLLGAEMETAANGDVYLKFKVVEFPSPMRINDCSDNGDVKVQGCRK